MGETTPRTQAESRIATARAHPRPRKRNSRGTPDELVVISMVCTISCLSTPNSYKKTPDFQEKLNFQKISHNFPFVRHNSAQFGPKIPNSLARAYGGKRPPPHPPL